ncbi:MAG: OstA-like protein, partial [Candidatus Cryptobacteroides sp.]
MNRIARFISIMLLVSVFTGICRPAFAQQQKEKSDSLVWLLEALSAQMYEIGDTTYRKVVGPARFLHNDTYLICDTALWNVDRGVIDAVGNVSIVQDGTVLTSDKMVYLVDYSLAKFRGSVVQLEDKDHNMLRTGNLDYYTKDSVGIFRQGASMRDKDGQIIESINGTYDSKISTFVFRDDVNMFTDSIFVKT